MNPEIHPAIRTGFIRIENLEPSINVLALDIDGVLNRCGVSGQGLESDKVALLKSITDQTGCGILLTSTWRKTEHQLARIKRMCQDIGAVFLGCTPISNTQATSGLYTALPRWKEIKAWRDEHPEALRLVILDDEREMGSLSGYHIRTDSHTGLTPSIAEQVITAMKRETRSIESIVFQPRWPEGLDMRRYYELPCDDKGRNGGTWMRVLLAEDGDVHVMMQEWEDIPKGSPDPLPSIRIRTHQGGGRHSRTRQALLWLAKAIQMDQDELEGLSEKPPHISDR